VERHLDRFSHVLPEYILMDNIALHIMAKFSLRWQFGSDNYSTNI